MTPAIDSVKNIFREEVEQRYMVGIVKKEIIEYQRVGPIRALQDAFWQTWMFIYLTFMGVVKIIQNVVPASELGGPIMIAQLAGEQARAGMYNLAYFMGLLSVNLGILNLLPIPVLDGGHLVFLTIEGIRRKPLNERAQIIAQQIGIALLGTLMIFVFYNDIVRNCNSMADDPLILSFDTSTSCCSIAVTAAGEDSAVLGSISLCSSVYSFKAPASVLSTGCLNELSLSLGDIDAIAVGLGPGSFTGLRNRHGHGQRTSRMGAEKPLIGISSLDALAASVRTEKLVCAVLDARKKEVYYCFYLCNEEGPGRALRPPPMVSPPETLAESIKEPILMVGDGVSAYSTLLTEKLGSLLETAHPRLHHPAADMLGFLAGRKFQSGSFLEPADAVPTYVRASDAETEPEKTRNLNRTQITMSISRRTTRQIMLGAVPIGGDAPISVQSMTNTDTADVDKTVSQIHTLEKAGCEIIRVAVPDIDAAEALRDIRDSISIPLIADIHFDWRLAVASMEHGAQGIRINPGNLGGAEKLKKVVDAAKHHKVPIRVGVNSGFH